MAMSTGHGTATDPRPLGGYALIAGVYVTLIGGGLAIGRRRGWRLPERIEPYDLALGGIATYRVSRLVAKDRIGSVVRAPFTEYEGPAGHGEERERPAAGGVRRAIGSLLLCPYCIGQWIATAFAAGFAAAPRPTRFIATIGALHAISDLLQLGSRAMRERQPTDAGNTA